MALISSPVFSFVSGLVTNFIADNEAALNNSPSNTNADARLLLIAIENAKNTYAHCVADQPSFLKAKEKEFREMLDCLKKVDACRLNLAACISRSIDSGTSDEWFPKLTGVNPQYVVPMSGVGIPEAGLWKCTIELFGQWKYAAPKTVKTYMPKLFFGDTSFEPIQSDQHTLTFQPTFKDCPFLPNKCSRLTGRLIVPYEVGNFSMIMSNQRTFTFDILILALPINAGKIAITVLLANGQLGHVEHTMQWGETRFVDLTHDETGHFIFTSFDGKKQEFTAADLDESASKVFPEIFTKQASYLKVTTAGGGRHRWIVETVPPIGL